MRMSYADCIRRSKRATWELEHFRDIELDFFRPFLPDNLAATRDAPELSERERLLLNQIRGHAYAHIFQFVEEYIVALVEDLLIENGEHGADRPRALKLFLAEEKKHQALFALFKERFAEGFGTPCGLVGNMREVAATLIGRPRLSVLILTAMLEWLTQEHYLAYFDDSETGDIDDGFRELFRLHWVEEAQHARLDSIEALRVAGPMDASAREGAVAGFLELCDLLKPLLRSQAELDVESLERVADRKLADEERAAVLERQVESYHHTFIYLGLGNRHFRKLLAKVSPAALDAVDTYLRGAKADV